MHVRVRQIKSNGNAKYVELSVEDFWTRVRNPPPPPNDRYANTCNLVPLPDIFSVLWSPSTTDYDTEAKRQMHKTTYAEIKEAWFDETYGQVVTNLDISRTKQRCGLTTVPYKARQFPASIPTRASVK